MKTFSIRDTILEIFPGDSSERDFLFQSLRGMATGQVFDCVSAACISGWPIHKVWKLLQTVPGVKLTSEGDIVSFFGLTHTITDYSIDFGRRRFYLRSAIDALLIPVIVRLPCSVTAIMRDSARTARIDFSQDRVLRVSPGTLALYKEKNASIAQAYFHNCDEFYFRTNSATDHVAGQRVTIVAAGVTQLFQEWVPFQRRTPDEGTRTVYP